MIPIGATATFQSPYQYGPDDAPDLTRLNGRECIVVDHITEADESHDAEVLPMYRITFAGDLTIEAWPEEIER